MKAIQLRCVGIAGAALLWMNSLVFPVQADEMVPYKASGYGYAEEFVVHDPDPDNGHPGKWYTGVLVEVGEATHFGLYTVRWELVGDLVRNEEGIWTIEFVGTLVQTAADGSTITGDVTHTEVLVPGGPPYPGYGTVEIVSGTGRFEGATGSWEVIAETNVDYDYVAIGEISTVGSVRGNKKP